MNTFEQELEPFIAHRFRAMDDARAAHVGGAELKRLLREHNPYLERVARPGFVSDLIDALLDRWNDAFGELLFDEFLADLAVFVSEQKCGGRKSAVEGIDVEMDRDGVRYLIAVKSGKAWGNSTQVKRLESNFQTAVRVLRQNKAIGQVQPTLGICYGRFKTADNGKFLHIGGQAFWELISGEPELYVEIVEPIGHRAREFNDAFHTQRANAMNRMGREFALEFCREDGSIDWPKVVTLVSKNR